MGGLKNDSTFNRLTAEIHDAVKQFNAVNILLDHPNVMAIVNRDFSTGCLDLNAVYTGNFMTEGREAHPIYRNYSEGRIRKEEDTSLYLAR